MANANVVAGAERLKVALRNLQERWRDVDPTWNDDVRRRFEERWLVPLEPATDAADYGARKLGEILSQLRRDLIDRSEIS